MTDTTATMPQQFGSYVLLRKIAMGGMAEIFKARAASTTGLGRDIVIKRILPSYTDDEGFVKMFIDEAAITSKLQHPNIVQIFDFDLVDDTYFIAMELIEGVDLKKAVDLGRKQGTPLSVAQCVWIIMEVCKGLHYAHTKEHRGEPLNIVHRDISPHNVMVSYEGDVKLMDFGIAKAAQRSTKTMIGTVKGKVAYMSPEQARGKDLDGRSDLFALGIMLWEMLTGKRLFLGDSDFETLTNVLKTDAPPASSLNPLVPTDLDDIIALSLKKNRDDRYPHVEAFGQALTRWYYQHVTDLEAESVRGFMQSHFAPEIAQLAADNAADGSPSAPQPASVPQPASAPQPAAPAPTLDDADRTVAMSLDDAGAFSQAVMQTAQPAVQAAPNDAPTVLDDSITAAQLDAALKAAAPAPAPATLPAPPDPMPAADTEVASGSKLWLWITLVVVLGGGAAAFFLLR